MPNPSDRIICERCNTAEAVLHLTRVHGGAATAHHYCPACGTALGADVIAVPAQHPPQPEPRPRRDNAGES